MPEARSGEWQLSFGPGGRPYPYQLKLPLAPYRFVWRDDAAVGAEKSATDAFTEESGIAVIGTTRPLRIPRIRVSRAMTLSQFLHALPAEPRP